MRFRLIGALAALLCVMLVATSAATAAGSDGSYVARFDISGLDSVQCPNFYDEGIAISGSILVRAQLVTDGTETQHYSFQIVRQDFSGYGTISGIRYRYTAGEHSVTKFYDLVTAHFREQVVAEGYGPVFAVDYDIQGVLNGNGELVLSRWSQQYICI
jgi:hypothetical protein